MNKVGKLNLFGAKKCTPVQVECAGNEVVLGFIQKLVNNSEAPREMLHTIFWEERSYWFAFMLQTALQRGQIVTFRYDPHCAWQDVDVLCYSIDGLCKIEYPETARRAVTCYTPAEFIRGFIGKDNVEAEIMVNIFRNDYCWYFAKIMQEYCRRGNVCIAAPYGHIVWEDTDGVPYDCYGLYKEDYIYLIPESYLGDTIEDFMHVPGKSKFATRDDVVRIMTEFEKDTGKSGGVQMMLNLTKESEDKGMVRGKSKQSNAVCTLIKGITDRFSEPLDVVKDKLTNRDHCIFTIILGRAFNRGLVCLLVPDFKFVWRDDDGRMYTIEGEVSAGKNIATTPQEWGALSGALDQSPTYLSVSQWEGVAALADILVAMIDCE